ncbi:unnamed protein product, partial [Closterium sp. NIES-53]
LREKLAGTIFSLMEDACSKALAPVCRPMWWLDPDDAETFPIGDQFAIGDDIIVAPVVVKGQKKRDVYLPKGTWCELLNPSNMFEGPTWLEDVEAPLHIIPIYCRVVPTDIVSPRMEGKEAVEHATFQEAPAEWRDRLLAERTAEEIAEATNLICIGADRAKRKNYWRILKVDEERLVVKRVEVVRGQIIPAPYASPFAVRVAWATPIKEVDGRVLGPLGHHLTRLRESALCKGGELTSLKTLRKAIGVPAEKPKQQVRWEKVYGGAVNWAKVITTRDSMVVPSWAREVLLRLHSRNLQVGARLPFLGDLARCPHCGADETEDHCLMTCQEVGGVVGKLQAALKMFGAKEEAKSAGDLLFRNTSTKSSFPELTLVAITVHQLWLERCGAVFRQDRF